MIVKFGHKGLRELFEKGATRRINKTYHDRIIDLLDILDAATGPRDLSGVSDFHPLKGTRRGTYSMHVSGNWVVTFRFDGNDVADVDFEDYH